MQDTCANRSNPIKSPTNSSKDVSLNYAQQSSDAFPLMKSYMAEKAKDAKPLTLSTKIKNSMMDFTDIKYPSTVATKPLLKNSSSIESSDTINSPSGQYDDDEFDTSSTNHTQGTNELTNNSDQVESIDDLQPIGDYNYGRYQSYSDQRVVIDGKHGDDDLNDIDKLRADVQQVLVENEAFMDKLCESMEKEVKFASRNVKKDVKASIEKAKVPLRTNIKGKESVAKKGRVTSASTKKKSLDQTKKTELLAQLKAIDGSE